MKIEKQSIPISVIFHLAPGLINLVVYIMLVQITDRIGLPNTIALYFMIILSILTVQISILLIIAKKKLGTYHILQLIPWFQKSKWWEYILYIGILAVWALLVSAFMTPVEQNIQTNIFSFFPANLIVDNYDPSSLSSGMIIFISLFGFITNGIIAPVVEELYFRGFLLPRINTNENVAVIISAVLFSFYHFFSPWAFFSRILMMIPLYYVVVKKKNLRFSIASHIIANSITSLSLLSILL